MCKSTCETFFLTFIIIIVTSVPYVKVNCNEMADQVPLILLALKCKIAVSRQLTFMRKFGMIFSLYIHVYICILLKHAYAYIKF